MAPKDCFIHCFLNGQGKSWTGECSQMLNKFQFFLGGFITYGITELLPLRTRDGCVGAGATVAVLLTYHSFTQICFTFYR